jgi:O-antigen/teichoic acid export membrane protein
VTSWAATVISLTQPLARGPLRHGVAAFRLPGTRLGGLAVADQAAVSATTFLTTVAVGRVDGADGLGLFTLAFALIVIVIVVQEAMIGIPYAVFANRAEAAARAAYAGTLLLHHLVLSGLVTGALVLAAAVATDAGAGRGQAVLWTLAAVTPMALLRDFCRRLLLAELRVGAALGVDAAAGALQLLALAWLWSTHRLSAETALAAHGVAGAVVAVAWLVPARSRFVLRGGGVRETSRETLAFGKWILGAQVTSAVHGYLVPAALALAFGAQATGRFTACETVVMLSNPIMLSAGNILTPQATRAVARGAAPAVWPVVWRAVAVLGAVLGLFGVLVAAFGTRVLEVLYGTHVAGGHVTMILLALSVLLASPGIAFDAGLRAVGRPSLTFRAGLLSLSVSLVALAALMVPLGIVGAAGAVLGGRVAGTVARYVALRRAAHPARPA